MDSRRFFVTTDLYQGAMACKHDSVRSHLQPWPKDLKLHLVVIFVYLTQHYESVADLGFGKGGMCTVATTPPFDAHAHRCNESGCCCFNGL